MLRISKNPPNIPSEVAQKEWSCSKIGIRKELIDFIFTSMTKATEISNCLIEISELKNLGERETKYLNQTEDFWIQLGQAVTPIDYYLEIVCQQMYIGETSRCFVKTKTGEEISFVLRMIKIAHNPNKHYSYQLSVAEMYELASQYKQNGVEMFKKYPKFAQEYFCRAAKCLISYQPFEVLQKERDGVDPKDLQNLFENIQTNLAACLLKENRDDDVLHVTDFVNDGRENISEKAIYRRAMALCNSYKYEEAKTLLEKNNVNGNKALTNLYNRVIAEGKRSDKRYSNMVQKMFSTVI